LARENKAVRGIGLLEGRLIEKAVAGTGKSD